MNRPLKNILRTGVRKGRGMSEKVFFVFIPFRSPRPPLFFFGYNETVTTNKTRRQAMFIFKSRPDHTEWKPIANFSDSDEGEAYKRAAKKLSIDIKISYPIPAPAGADLCAGLGMKGIYIRRSQAEKESDLNHSYFEELRAMST